MSLLGDIDAAVQQWGTEAERGDRRHVAEAVRTYLEKWRPLVASGHYDRDDRGRDIGGLFKIMSMLGGIDLLESPLGETTLELASRYYHNDLTLLEEVEATLEEWRRLDAEGRDRWHMADAVRQYLEKWRQDVVEGHCDKQSRRQSVRAFFGIISDRGLVDQPLGRYLLDLANRYARGDS